MDIEVLIPPTRRAIDGPTAETAESPSATLTDSQITGLIADAIAEISFHAKGLWGHALEVTGTDNVYGAPDEWAVTPELDADEQTVVVAVAALNHFVHRLFETKISQSISHEGASWSYQLSANALTEHLKLLRERRDEALARIGPESSALLVRYGSILHARDATVAAAIEPFTAGAAAQGFPPLR